MDQEAALKALREPFTKEQIGKLPKITCQACSKAADRVCSDHKKKQCRKCGNWITEKHVDLDYVGHAHVRERLLNVDPEWTWRPMGRTPVGLPAFDDDGGLWIELTVAGMTRVGYGDAPGKRGGNAMKETIGDAIRNAAQSFGVALDLWKKESPEPAPGASQAEEKPLTPEQRAVELRKLISVEGKRAGKSLDQIATDFNEWTEGRQEIASAGVATLSEYHDARRRGGWPA